MREELESLGERIAEQCAHLDAAMHGVLSDLRTFDQQGGWYAAGARSCAHWLSWRVGWTLGTARDRVRVAKALGGLPRIDEALRRGEISYSKVRAMVRVATPQNEELLLHDARFTTASDLESICRKLQTVQRLSTRSAEEVAARRQVGRQTLEDGMVKIEAILRPDEAALLWAALGPKVDGRADALVALAKGATDTTVEVIVQVPAAALTGSTDEVATVAGDTHVSAETARRLACDAAIVPLIESASGEIISVGRKTRVLSAALRRALLRRDDGKCQFPGCNARAHLDAHHLQHWARGGDTALPNLVTLCTHHHAFVHEHGYRVELGDDGHAHFFDPRGRRVEPRPPRPRPPRLGMDAIRARNAPLAITAATNACRWDGEPIDDREIVAALARRGFRGSA